MNQLATNLRTIGLFHTSSVVDDFVADATKKRLSPTQMLERIVEAELSERT